MERCHGKTRSGDRCKRSAPEGSLYCGMHADQESADAQDSASLDDELLERGFFDTLVVVAAAGIALGAALAFRRIFRFG